MSNYIEYKDKIAFHPGYYIKEIVDESGLTQEDFAKRLDTTPKNLSKIINGEQKLSVDMAIKLSRMLGTSANYWLNLQSTFDSLVADFKSDEELDKEKQIFRYLDYRYFRENFKLPDLPRKTNEQIKCVREFLQVATLQVFTKRDMAVSFRSASAELTESGTVKANIMVQIATNYALKYKDSAPAFNQEKWNTVVDYALTLTKRHEDFFPLIRKAFYDAGVILVVLPNLSGSKINGATKKLGKNIMLMVNDRRLYADTFWFTLFHEIGHIMNGDYGISFENETGQKEKDADAYAENKLIPPDKFDDFIKTGHFSNTDIIRFADSIDRDAGIVVGRLEKEEIIRHDDPQKKLLKRKYRVKVNVKEN